MNRKERKEKRKKRYFIDAAKEIIEAEGVQRIRVKEVAELAGFAPGTLYNYFKNLDELLVHCVDDYWIECKDYVLAHINQDDDAKTRIITAGKAYCEYFIDNPEIYQLIFIEDLSKIPEGIPEAVKLLIEQIKVGVRQNVISEDEAKIIKNILGNSIHGLILFYNKKRTDSSKEEILDIFEEEVEYLLESDRK